MITYKNGEEINKMRRAGHVAAEILQELSNMVAPGVNLLAVDRAAEELIMKRGGIPTFKGYRGYKHSTCLSVNHEVVHGIPTDRALQAGDLLGIDIGVTMDGFCSDTAMTIPVGKVNKRAQKLLKATKEALRSGIRQAMVGKTIGDIGFAIESVAKRYGYSVVRDLFGHGIGRALHEDPMIPNFGRPGEGIPIRPGMTIAIEPMLNLGTGEVETLPDGWTVVTRDGSLSAHFEHTVAITPEGPQVLTATESDV